MSAETTDPWSGLEPILERVLELDPDDRSGFLDGLDLEPERRRELDSLIVAAEDEPTLFDVPVRRFLGGSPDEEPDGVGPYRFVELLGRGGMGAVYLARRTDGVYSTQVAVKLMQGHRLDPTVVQRFRAEREILASLRHPHIAQMLDGGTTDDGRPYLVMERVEGVPIDRWCAERNASVEDRLRLFLKVCGAVHFAHQNLVVHRDLKPGNILVTPQGEPKLLDFGIAKLLDDAALPAPGPATATGLAPMTPAYASPEQIAGGVVTTSTDIYALGVLLYELLCGRRPHEVKAGQGAFDLLQAIREQEPTLPSHVVTRSTEPTVIGLPPRKLSRRLRGDLDHIVLQALDKNPARRYPSAEQLAADLERHLDGRPVRASSAGFTYRTAKFVGRHRLAVSASALALFLLLASLVALLVQRRATLEERDRAELTTSFLVDQFHDADPFAEAAPRTVRALLDRSVERLRTMDAPSQVRMDLEAAMGRAYLGLGAHDVARELLESAAAGQAETGDRAGRFQSLLLLSSLGIEAGRPERALGAARQALELAEGTDEESAAWNRMARAQQQQGRFEEAESLFLKALDLAPVRGRERAELLWSLGILLHEDGRYDEAEARLSSARELLEELWGEGHPRVARAVISLGILAGDQGKFDRARRLLEAAGRSLEEQLGPLHPERVAIFAFLARVEQLAGNLDLAEQLLRRAADLLRQEAAGPDPRLAATLDQLGHLLASRRQLDEAESLLQEALAMRRGFYGELHPEVAESLEHMGFLHYYRGDDERAIEQFAEAYEVMRATLGEDHPLCGVYLRHQGNALLRMERYGEALPIFERAQRILESRLGSSNNHVAALYNSLGYTRHKLGELDAGREAFREAVAGMERAWGEDHPQVGLYRNNLARLELDAGRLEEAWEQAEAARVLLEGGRPYEHAHRLRNDVLRARCLVALDRRAEAEQILRRRLEHLDQQEAPPPRLLRPVLEVLVQALPETEKKGFEERLAALEK